MSSDKETRKLAAIMHADVKGYSPFMGKEGPDLSVSWENTKNWVTSVFTR